MVGHVKLSRGHALLRIVRPFHSFEKWVTVEFVALCGRSLVIEPVFLLDSETEQLVNFFWTQSGN